MTLHTRLLSEPFRLFFPLGMVLGFIGVSHWGWYYSGVIDTYSCNYHGLMLIQGFEAAFVVGFTMTAFPRFTETVTARAIEVWPSALTLMLSAWLLREQHWSLAEVAFILLYIQLFLFWLRRYLKRQDDPPAAFSLVPIGIGLGVLGAVLVIYPIAGFVKLGHRLIEQGSMLCFLLAFGSHLGPRLISGPSAETTEPGVSGRFFVAIGLVLGLSFFVEAGVNEPAGRLLRAIALTVAGLKTWPIGTRPGLRRFSAWVMRMGFWSLILGQWLSGLFPDYEIVALHFTFLGGFATLTFVISIRVIAAHCGPETMWSGRARALKWIGILMVVTLVCRVISDFIDWYYFGMLHVAAGFWMLAVIIWFIVYVPKLSHSTDE